MYQRGKNEDCPNIETENQMWLCPLLFGDFCGYLEKLLLHKQNFMSLNFGHFWRNLGYFYILESGHIPSNVCPASVIGMTTFHVKRVFVPLILARAVAVFHLQLSPGWPRPALPSCPRAGGELCPVPTFSPWWTWRRGAARARPCTRSGNRHCT